MVLAFVVVTVEAEQSHGHVKDALVVDRDQWLKVLALHRIFKGLHNTRQNCCLHSASPSFPRQSLCRLGELFRFGDRLLDCADHVECLFR